MLKSLTESLRSLWHTKADEGVQRACRKRKRPANEGDHDDSDVEVVSVKIPKTENPDSAGSGLLSLLKVPMSRMSEWVRRKTVRQDHFFVRPIPADSHWHRRKGGRAGRDAGREAETAAYGAGEVHARNGSLGPDLLLQEEDRLARPPVHSRNGVHENGVNGERGAREYYGGVLNSSTPSSRRSSFSSSRPGLERQSTVDKCFHLKEREDYLKLLQQFTTVDLGYHGSKNQTVHRHRASDDETGSQRKPGACLPVPSAPSALTTSLLPLTSRSDPNSSARFRVTPSRFSTTSSLPSDKAKERPVSSSSSSSRGRFAVPHGPGRALRVGPMPQHTGRKQPSSLAPGGIGVSQHPHAATPVSSIDPSTRTVPECDSDQRLKVTAASDGDRRSGTVPDSTVGCSEVVVVESDGNQRLGVTPASEAELGPVLDGHRASLDSGSTPGVNFKSSEYLDEDWLERLKEKYAASETERQRLILEVEVKRKLLEERREARLSNLGKKLEQQMRLFDEEPEVIEELPLPEVPQEKPLPELTEAMQREIRAALADGPPTQVLAGGFRLQLTRADIATLRGLNWLNDEVINFYMNMLMERGEQEGFDKTYAFNTFFYPKLLSGGHAAVKRWTRKVDIFAHHYLIIPVHLGVHWCLCMVFVKDKKVCYYDSMGGNNNQCRNAVRQYLAEESLQKRNIQLDLSEWTSETIKDIPQQMNGSDCGMFACMYAETLTRGDNITFTQKDMPYFRRKMVYEILKKTLL